MTFTKVAVAALTALVLSVTAAQAQSLNGVYVGANLGNTMQDSNRGMIGINLGYLFQENFAVETTYDYNQVSGNPNNAQMIMFNAVASYPNTSVFTPYVLAGTGLGWNAASGTNNGTMGMWNVGAGFHVALSPQLSLDNRYRYVGPYNSATGRDAQVITTGINYKF
jgi:opacity protein-like surface antigen